MKWINPIRLLLLPAVVLTLASCRKHDPVCLNCPPVPQCPVASLTQTNEEGYPFFSVQRNFMNVPVKLEYYERNPAGSNYETVLNVHYQGRNLYLLDAANADTVLLAKLDECGRPVWSFFPEKKYLPEVPVTSYYSYNTQGRLSRYESYEGELGTVQQFSYDQRGNLLKIYGGGGAHEFEYTYDYTKPVAKGTVMYAELRTRRETPMAMLEYLGHIDLMPRNQRLTSRSWTSDYEFWNFTYGAHVFSGGRLVSYEGAGTYALTWSCSKPSHSK